MSGITYNKYNLPSTHPKNITYNILFLTAVLHQFTRHCMCLENTIDSNAFCKLFSIYKMYYQGIIYYITGIHTYYQKILVN